MGRMKDNEYLKAPQPQHSSSMGTSAPRKERVHSPSLAARIEERKKRSLCPPKGKVTCPERSGATPQTERNGRHGEKPTPASCNCQAVLQGVKVFQNIKATL
eukprot:1160458-Pelagomonas_calceolata.AAC.3